MRYLKKYKLFESVNEQDVHYICRKYGIENYTINSDRSIDVDGDVDLNDHDLTKLPLRFRNVSGDFYCYNNNLTSLEGSPSEVGGNFYCYNNQLTSLEGAPTSGSYFYYHNNKLTSLKGLEWKSFNRIDLRNNPVYEIVKDWINNEDRIDLIEYFIDMNVIQEGEDKPKLILPSFHEEMNLEMNINFKGVIKNYEIIK